MKKNIERLIITVTVIVLSMTSTLIYPSQTSAVIDCEDSRLSANDIVFWDPCSSECAVDTTPVSSNETSTSVGRDKRLEEVIFKYGEHAMNMQREWGTPWELVFAQMVMESSVGTAGIAVNGATNNWLGIKGTGDAGTTGRDAKYSSIEASISDWAGKRVLRNGLYDKAFVHTSPTNYNIKEFFAVMIEVYAPTSDGNDVGEYKSVIYGLLDGPIKSAREAKGWPSAAELAKKENIPIGGKHPLGSETSGGGSGTSDNMSPDLCGNQAGAVQGEIAQTAINLSWPTKHALNDPKPAYSEAMKKLGLSNQGCGPHPYGADCGVFVATVMKSSGADPNFPIGTGIIKGYLRGNSNYTRIRATDTGSLLPGDIFVVNDVGSGHIMMYVGDVASDGGNNNAQASCSDWPAHRGGAIYFSDSRGDYEIYRKK